MPAALEPLAITITTLPEPSTEPVLDPDITLTSESEEETYELAEDYHMDIALMSRPTEFKAGLPEDFSGKNDDATRWLLAMKAYFIINDKVYTEDATTVLIFLNKLSKGRGATFAEGWYMKLANPGIPDSEKTFKKLCKAFEEAFIPKDLKDRARQTVYSLNMDQFNGDFDEYSTAFKLAQACCRVDDDSILVDALQRGVTQQLTVMMTSTTLSDGQTSWKWEQWLDKAGEFYQMWYNLGNSEEEETVTSRQLTELLTQIPMLWMWTKSTFPQMKEWSISETKNASSAIRKDVTHPSTKDTPEKGEREELQQTTPGERLQRPRGRSKPTQKLPTS